MTAEDYPYSHLLFSRPVNDRPFIPKTSGIYFICGDKKIYIGYSENLNKRIPQSILYQKFGLNYHFLLLPVFSRPNLKEIEEEMIITAHTIIFVNRLEQKYNIELVNKTYLYGLPLAAWNPIFAHKYIYSTAVVQSVLRAMGVPPEDILLRKYAP